ncbi:hypothetical protein GCM10011418_16060 [Sphingobacterium alkalisoli]|nr:hypothetical protein GCM10011418_16060 [Sphingobacterium alkalisoli]
MAGLPDRTYSAKTQQYYTLESRPNCKIDLVLESEDILCFIEIKVESSEGNEQLDRYCEVLDNIKGKKTLLRYCTKYREEKEISKHDFFQFTWHHVAKLLSQYHGKPYLTDYYEFLKTQKMADNFQITAEKLKAAEVLQDTLKTFDHYLSNSKKDFEACFGRVGTDNASKSKFGINKDNRIGYRITNILNLEIYNEIMYSIDLDTQLLNVHLFISRDSSYEQAFSDAEKLGFKFVSSINGIAIHRTQQLAEYLNIEDPSMEITCWYQNAFERFKIFLDNNGHIFVKKSFINEGVNDREVSSPSI